MPDWLVHENLKGAVIVETMLYTAIGLMVFALAIWIMNKVVPFSLRKEIEEDQNTSLGIIIGSVIIGIALIISAILK